MVVYLSNVHEHHDNKRSLLLSIDAYIWGEKKLEQKVLVDSSATREFIDKEKAKELGTTIFELENPILALNADGTEVQNGKIKYGTWMMRKIDGQPC